MSQTSDAFVAVSSLTFWFKVTSEGQLTIADLPELISTRWPYFRDNWNFILDGLKENISSYIYPNKLKLQIDQLDRLIVRQRDSANKNINPFNDSGIHSKYYSVWENILFTDVPTSRQEQEFVDRKIRETKLYTKTNFVDIQTEIITARDNIADITGLTDATYNASFFRSPIISQRNATLDDINVLQSLNKALSAITSILANLSSLNTMSVDPFALARANANNPEIDIQTGNSSTLVRMYYGDSLQDLASRHLNDPDRWLEIAITNGLKEPYIDEIGSSIELIANGSGNQLIIKDIAADGTENIQKVFIGQIIFIQSDTNRAPIQRKINNVTVVPVSNDIIIEVDGDLDLNKFKTIDNASIRVYEPNTINSNFLVSIPSDEAAAGVRPGSIPFFLESAAADEKQAGVDLLLTEDMDLNFTSNSDLNLSFGLQNAVQAIQLMLTNERGQNSRHLQYGLPAVQGTPSNDINGPKEQIVSSIEDMIGSDSRFDRLESLNVQSGEGIITVSMDVRMAGTGTVVPITFTVNNG